MAVIELVDEILKLKKDKPKKVEAENKEKLKLNKINISLWQKSTLSMHKHIIHELVDGLSMKSNIFEFAVTKII